MGERYPGSIELNLRQTVIVQLIATIEDWPLSRRATFTSPVTRDPVSGREQFRLAFELETAEPNADAGQ